MGKKKSDAALERSLLVTTLVVVLLFIHTDSFKVTFTSCAEEKPMLTIFSFSLAACLKECDHMDDCETVLYIRMIQKCQLHRQDLDGTGDTCGRNALIRLKDAREILSIDTRFDPQYCPMYETRGKAVIIGNRQSVGTKLQLTCAKSYAMVGESTILCHAPGIWSQSGQCINTCAAPTATENMEFARATVEFPTETEIYQNFDPRSIQWFENSTIVINCLDDSILIGPSSITCSTGSWSEIPECKIPTMRQPCQGDDECIDINSECRGGTCWCKPELSYNPANMTCVSSCQVYGNTFQVVEGDTGIKGLNEYVHPVVNREACMELCLNYTSKTNPNYECKHADYMPEYGTVSIKGRCHLTRDVTPLPKAVALPFANDYLLRDCAPE